MSNHCLTKAWNTRGLTGSQKLVLIRLADRAGDDGICWPGQTSLAEECCLTTRTVRTVLGELVSMGHLKVVCPATFDRPARYRVTPKAVSTPEAVAGEERATPPEIPSGGERQIVPERKDFPEGNQFPSAPERISAPSGKDFRLTQREPKGNQEGSHTAGEAEGKPVPEGKDFPPLQLSGVVNAHPPVPPPTLAEAIAFGERSGITRNITEKWFYECDGRQWLDRNTQQPIGKWQSNLKAFELGWKDLQGRHAAANARATTPRRAVGPSRDPLDI